MPGDTHPRRFIVEASPDFLKKAVRAVEILRAELPECCRRHVVERQRSLFLFPDRRVRDRVVKRAADELWEGTIIQTQK